MMIIMIMIIMGRPPPRPGPTRPSPGARSASLLDSVLSGPEMGKLKTGKLK